VSAAWQGKSGLNTYADLVMETDAMVGRVLAALAAAGVADHTLVIFTSDNGCAPYVGLRELATKGHFPSGPLRGYKADTWEGGHRVPFIVRWPGRVPAGSTSGQLVLQSDCMATFAAILGQPLPADAAEDSVNLLPLLEGRDEPVRQFAICQAGGGQFSLRDGPWKFIFGPDGGGYESSAWVDETPTALVQLYNLAAQRPDVVERLFAKMEQMVGNGRTTPGPNAANDVPVDWQRFIRAEDKPKTHDRTPH
jgi:arylsulfatase A-like enzyme